MAALCHADLQVGPGASESMLASAQGEDYEQAMCTASPPWPPFLETLGLGAVDVCSRQLQLVQDSELRLPVLTHAPHSAHAPLAASSESTS